MKKFYYPGHAIACRQQSGFGAMLSFKLDGDETTLRRFLTSLELFPLAESLGGVESLISHAATMTHAGMAAEARAPVLAKLCCGCWSGSKMRVLVGIEDSEDLIADLEQAFQAALQR